MQERRASSLPFIFFLTSFASCSPPRKMKHQDYPVSYHISGDKSPIPQMITPMPSKAFTDTVFSKYGTKPNIGRGCPGGGDHESDMNLIKRKKFVQDHQRFRLSFFSCVFVLLNVWILLEALGLRKFNLLFSLGSLVFFLYPLPTLVTAYSSWMTRLHVGDQAPLQQNDAKNAAASGSLKTMKIINTLPEYRLLFKHISVQSIDYVVQSQELQKYFCSWTFFSLLFFSLSDFLQSYLDMGYLYHLEDQDQLVSLFSFYMNHNRSPALFGVSPPGIIHEGFSMYPPRISKKANFSFFKVTREISYFSLYFVKFIAILSLSKALYIFKKRTPSSPSSPSSSFSSDLVEKHLSLKDIFSGSFPLNRKGTWMVSIVCAGLYLSYLYTTGYLFLPRPSLLLHNQSFLDIFHTSSLNGSEASKNHMLYMTSYITEWVLRLFSILNFSLLAMSLITCSKKSMFTSSSQSKQIDDNDMSSLSTSLTRRASRVFLFIAVALQFLNFIIVELTSFLPSLAHLDFFLKHTHSDHIPYLFLFIRILYTPSHLRLIICLGSVFHFISTFFFTVTGMSLGLRDHLVSILLRGKTIDEYQELPSLLRRSSSSFASHPFPTLLIQGEASSSAKFTYQDRRNSKDKKQA